MSTTPFSFYAVGHWERHAKLLPETAEDAYDFSLCHFEYASLSQLGEQELHSGHLSGRAPRFSVSVP
jgi:hypothetical protein